MKTPPPRFQGKDHTSRSLALQVLLTGRDADAFVQEVLDAHLTSVELSTPDRRLATQLAYGVLRRRGTLDALLRPFVTRPPHQVEPWLWDALRIGAFQLVLLTHVPPHAVLHTTVELAAQFGRPDAKGFLNGVLRKLAALITDEQTRTPAPNALPLEGGTYRVLAQPVLPDPGVSPVEYLSHGFALPRWLVTRWVARWGWEESLRVAFWFAGPAPLWLRTNPLRTTREECLAAIRAVGIEAEAGEHPQAIRLRDHATVRDLPGYEPGWFAVQDQAAMAVASAGQPEPGWSVLDVCAAPGGKTTHLAELMNNTGQIVACDVDDTRLQTVANAARRLGVTIVETSRLHPERNQEPPKGPFDAVLVDVPCSNTGVLGRRPEVRWRLKETDLRHLVPLQVRLLLQAGERVKPGGVVVYSTCSIEPEENRGVVDTVRRGMPWLVVEAEQEQIPGHPADGGYWARVAMREGTMKALARAIITAVAFLELSDDDAVDPDAACGALEEIGSELANCTPEEVQMLRTVLAQVRASEQLNEARPEVLEFLESFLASMGLEDTEVG